MGYIITDIRSDYVNRENGNREIIASVVCDDAASLPVQRTDQTFVLSSDALDISTGDIYIINSSGQWIKQPSSNAWQNVYTKSEIDAMNSTSYQYMLYYHGTLESTDGSITFYTFGDDINSLTIYGNGEQSETPTPSAPITPEFVGTLDGTDWTIPITCAEQTTPIYLGQTSAVRKIKKLVLTGTETISTYPVQGGGYSAFLALTNFQGASSSSEVASILCTHYVCVSQNSLYNGSSTTCCSGRTSQGILFRDPSISSTADFRSFLTTQYSNGTPVTVWYVLVEPETSAVNDPLAKIGDYVDYMTVTSADISIPTARGENTLTVSTTLPPTKIVISGELEDTFKDILSGYYDSAEIDEKLTHKAALAFSPAGVLSSLVNCTFTIPDSSRTLRFTVGKLNATTNYLQIYVNGIDKGYITFDVSRNIDNWGES